MTDDAMTKIKTTKEENNYLQNTTQKTKDEFHEKSVV
jgi:hypothetical protein